MSNEISYDSALIRLCLCYIYIILTKGAWYHIIKMKEAIIWQR